MSTSINFSTTIKKHNAPSSFKVQRFTKKLYSIPEYLHVTVVFASRFS